MASNMQSVAYLGPKASFTHQAALSVFPTTSSIKHEPLPTIPAIFSAVQSGTFQYGVVPFYNTTHGAVIATLDCLSSGLTGSQGSTSDLRRTNICIRKEVKMPIRHFLLSYLGPESVGDSKERVFERIDKVLSHEQALGQCARFLDEHLPHAERVAVTSTSRAAEMVAASGRCEDKKYAAISSAMAAEEYAVDIVESDIQDRNDNMTRFFVLERGTAKDHIGNIGNGDKAKRSSLIVFTVSHAAPGALVKALMALMKHSLNMTGIHQRPPNETRQDDAIFVEVEGEVSAEALEDLGKEAVAVKLLGSWQES